MKTVISITLISLLISVVIVTISVAMDLATMAMAGPAIQQPHLVPQEQVQMDQMAAPAIQGQMAIGIFPQEDKPIAPSKFLQSELRPVSSTLHPDSVPLRPSIICGRKLAERTPSLESKRVPNLIHRHSVSKDQTFLRYVLALTYVESRFNGQAVSDKEAYGLMQVTQDAVQDVVGVGCGLYGATNLELLDSATNIKYGTCYLRKVLREAEGDWTRALIVYNGGYRQLLRYDSGKDIAPETANYILQVNRVLNFCSTTDTALAH